MRVLQDKLNRINESLSRKIQARQEYEKTLHETEAAYNKVRKLDKRKYKLAKINSDFGIFSNFITCTQEGKR